MVHPLKTFAVEAGRWLDLVRPREEVSSSQLVGFMDNRRRLDFMVDVLGRVRILHHCRESLLDLTDRYRELQTCMRALPADPETDVTMIPLECVEQDEKLL